MRVRALRLPLLMISLHVIHRIACKIIHIGIYTDFIHIGIYTDFIHMHRYMYRVCDKTQVVLPIRK